LIAARYCGKPDAIIQITPLKKSGCGNTDNTPHIGNLFRSFVQFIAQCLQLTYHAFL
jgi:hypothetical protein